MELLEYQAKELFRQMDIPVLPSQRITQPRDLKQLTIPYPVVLKSQVYTGGRGKAGGIKFVENTIDAMAAAQSIFHLPIMGRYPDVLLAEAKYAVQQEFYLAVVIDSSSRCPLLLGSQYGGEAVESHLDQIQQVTVDRAFSPFYARRLALKMGLQGNLIQAVSSIVEKMFALFMQQDLDLVEINPLGVSSTGELMALDGKVAVNDEALTRHPKLMELVPNFYKNGQASIAPFNPDKLKLIEMNGNIGVLCNGAGLTMATLDLIHRVKGKTAGFVDLGGECRHGWSLISLQERLEQGLDLITHAAGLKVILINILEGIVPCLEIAEVIARYVEQRPNANLTPIVLRLVGQELALAQERLAPLNIPVIGSLDEAVTTAGTLAKTPKG